MSEEPVEAKPLTMGDCENCGVLSMRTKVQGYLVCFDCEIRASIPFYMRDDK